MSDAQQIAVFHPLFSPEDVEPTGRSIELIDSVNIVISILEEAIAANQLKMALINSMIQSIYNIVPIPPKRRWFTRIFNAVLFIGLLLASIACGILVNEAVTKWLQ